MSQKIGGRCPQPGLLSNASCDPRHPLPADGQRCRGVSRLRLVPGQIVRRSRIRHRCHPLHWMWSCSSCAPSLLLPADGHRPVSWCVASEARDQTPCAQSSDLTQVPRDRTPCAQSSDLTQVPNRASQLVLIFWRAPSADAGRWTSVSWCVASEAGPQPDCAQSSDLTQMPSHALEMVLRSSPWPYKTSFRGVMYHAPIWTRFLGGKRVFLNSKIQTREFHAVLVE